ncbi:MAG: ABC transporter substrate-binding protein [Clostridia bacterium]|nr:ABC transporter substrate-binding protein [Clostridia bacterium]
MKNWRKVLALVLVLAMAFAMSVTASANEVVNDEADISSTPRNETFYIGGQQWGKPNDFNPYSSNSNNYLVAQNDSARVVCYETLYMYNMLDNTCTPLLADGDYVWNEDQTEVTVKINQDAHWSDGTPVTANDVKYTFDTHVKYQSATGIDMALYISEVEATDDYTVVFKANKDNYNPLKVIEYLPKLYITQAAYVKTVEEATSEDSEAFKTAEMYDAVTSGPYTWTLGNEEKVIVTRDDNYWGQAESMWGQLPVPKYIVHNIFSGNDAVAVAFENGEIDVNQQFVANIWTYWEDKGLDIATYIDEAPYFVDASMPTLWFNTTKEGLDNANVRVAIAMAIDYDQIISTAMSGYSYTFADVPHSLFNPTDAEQAMYAACDADGELSALNYAGKDIEGAKALLEETGIDFSAYEWSVECPTGWTDWNASCEIVAAAAKEIGLNVTTYFPEAAVYNEDIQTGNFDMAMATMTGAAIDGTWLRAYQTCYGFGGEIPERITYAYSRWYNERVDEILATIPVTTDEAELTALYKELNVIYLTECPSVALMYRPVYFHETNESVWSGFPEQGDGLNIPPTVCTDGYGIAALYNIYLVEE